MGCTTASPELIETLMKGCNHIGMICQAQVIITAKTGYVLTIQNDFCSLGRKQRSTLPE
jgi:hypothetical protein